MESASWRRAARMGGPKRGRGTGGPKLAASPFRSQIFTGPTPSGYRNRRVLAANEQVAVMIGRKEIGRITVSAILPRDRTAGGTGQKKNT
jgi:hypothetical protein